MKIISLKAENVKRLHAVEITPDGNVVVISGRNGQGKTSVLDSIAMALGGASASKLTTKPIREGQKEASVTVDLGDFTVTRKWRGSNSNLSVMSKDGAEFRSPQRFLDEKLGALSFDPWHSLSRTRRNNLPRYSVWWNSLSRQKRWKPSVGDSTTSAPMWDARSRRPRDCWRPWPKCPKERPRRSYPSPSFLRPRKPTILKFVRRLILKLASDSLENVLSPPKPPWVSRRLNSLPRSSTTRTLPIVSLFPNRPSTSPSLSNAGVRQRQRASTPRARASRDEGGRTQDRTAQPHRRNRATRPRQGRGLANAKMPIAGLGLTRMALPTMAFPSPSPAAQSNYASRSLSLSP